jgi:hypothetical protein
LIRSHDQYAPKRSIAIFFLVQAYQNGKSIPNGHKLYQMGTNYTKWQYFIPNGHKLYQTAIFYTKWSQIIPNCRKIYQHFPFQGPPNVPKYPR